MSDPKTKPAKSKTAVTVRFKVPEVSPDYLRKLRDAGVDSRLVDEVERGGSRRSPGAGRAA
jgi:hypothetical protein